MGAPPHVSSGKRRPLATRIEFTRLTGKHMVESRECNIEGGVDEQRQYARAALEGFYTGDEKWFWPLEAWRDRAPEEVRIVGGSGEVLAKYALLDIIRDTVRHLTGIPG